MYNQFFGFKEKPFKLVPNPEYLYLSRIHEEVLAHLNYSARFGEGFVEITGEVGTGKTTLCRMFLESLDEHTEAAYIFNPKLNALQLLKAINDEFGLPSDTDSIKSLIDRFNQFLLEKKVENKQVILLIDEAQNLSADVLEQLRLLSNLETTTSKLLQIILVGQPELSEMLETDNLRQLNQRISLSCQLTPLGQRETREYIRHRIHIASRKPGLAFSPRAYRAIYKFSGGVPRLINIACDRVLVTAYSKGKHQITHPLVKKALKELSIPKRTARKAGPYWEKWIVGLLAVLVLLVLAITASQFLPGWKKIRSAAKAVENEEVAETVLHSEAAHTTPPKVLKREIAPLPSRTKEITDLPAESTLVHPTSTAGSETSLLPVVEALTAADLLTSRTNALLAVLKQWVGPEAVVSGTMEDVDNDAFFEVSARRNDLEALKLQGELSDLRSLNLPAILEVFFPQSTDPRFVAIIAIEEDIIWLWDHSEPISASPEFLSAAWNGVAYVLWKDFFNYQGVIPVSSPGEVIVSLKVHLKRLGFDIQEMNGAYDAATRLAIEVIQQRNGLEVDGIVGPMTKIVLYNEDRLLDIPRLSGALQE
jgi:general secretion pathway protein A